MLDLTRTYPAPLTLLTLPLLAALTGACGDDGSYGGDYDAGYGEDSAPNESQGEQGDPEDPEGPNDDPGDPEPVDPDTCDAKTPVTLYLSPDDSNSTSSPVQVRDAVLGATGGAGGVPIRTWEFLNYYTFPYPAAERGALAVKPEIAQLDGMPAGQYLVQLGIASESMPNLDRPLMNITLVLDESGSMDGHPMDMQRAVCRAIAASLRAGDVVSMVGWDTSNAIKLAAHTVTGPADPTVVGECDALAAGGGTDLHGGLSAGYDLAHQQFDPARINRVVLVSDGGANAGVTDTDIIAAGAGGQDEDGIYLVGVGVGTNNTYNDALMDAVTDVGRGASLFIPSQQEADKMFGARFVQTMAVAARDVRVRLEMPPGFEIVRFSGEEYSDNAADIEPQHLAPDDAMVFHQTVETCAPELVDADATFGFTVQWKDAITREQRSIEVSKKIQELTAEESPMLRKGAAVFAYAEALKAWQQNPSSSVLTPAFDALTRAEATLGGDPDLAEIRAILEALR